MAARNSRPTSGAKRANKNTQGAPKTSVKTSPKGSRPKQRRSTTSGSKRSNYQKNKKFQGTPKKVGKVPSPKMTLKKGGQKARKQSSRTYKPAQGPN